MDYKIEIKEENPLTDDIDSQYDREFVFMKTSTDVVLQETDCDITVKTEIKSETPFIKERVKQIKTETATCCNWEIDRANDVEQNDGEFLPEDPEMMDNKYNSDHEMCNKIEIKNESWQLETDTSSVWDNTKDVDLPAVKSSRFSPESVGGAIHSELPLLSSELKARDTSLYDGMDHFEFEYKKSDVTEILTAKEDVHSENYGKSSDEGDIYIEPLYLKPISLGNVGKRLQKCSICAKTFSSPSHLKVHILDHEGKKLYQCKICDKSFLQLSNLKTHNLIHEGKKPHQCKVCDQRFTHLSNLKRHDLIHEGKKPHQCKVCGKRFTQMSSLKTHTLIHEGKKPHQCKICDRSFTDLSSLRTHYLVHEGKRPHQCKVCNKSFTQLSTLKRHNFLVHEGKGLYQCEVCNKSFNDLSGLKRHNLLHEDKRTP